MKASIIMRGWLVAGLAILPPLLSSCITTESTMELTGRDTPPIPLIEKSVSVGTMAETAGSYAEMLPPSQPILYFVYPQGLVKSNYMWQLEATVDMENWTSINYIDSMDSNGIVNIYASNTCNRFYRVRGNPNPLPYP